MKELIDSVEEWARARKLHEADPFKQLAEVTEEIGEVAGALARDDQEELRLEIGDGFVTLTILAMQNGMSAEECLSAAYDKIKGRTGKTVNGIYIKSDDL